MKNYILILSTLVVNFFYAQFGYNTIGNTVGVANINNGVCGEVDSCFTLTEDQQNQYGAVWDNKEINLNYNFDATFCMTLGSEDEWGADGFAFVMRGLGTISSGLWGEGLGFQTISPSIAIEFDCFQNTGIGDPLFDHTALYQDGNFANELVAPTSLLPMDQNVEDGGYHQARIVWNATSHLLEMYFDGNFRFSHTIDLVNDVFLGENLVIWGFTASTGGLSNLQQICFPKYSVEIDDIYVCENDSAQVHFYDPNLSSYNWTYEDGTVIKNWNTLDFTTPFDLNDTVFYTTQAGTYYLNVEINNQVVQDSLEVIYVPLPALPFTNRYAMTCFEDGNLTLNALNPGNNYLWSTGASSQQIQISQEGEYFVRITEPINSCQNFDTINVISFCMDTTICQGELAEVSFYEPGFSSYTWSFEDGTILKNWNNVDFSNPFNLDDTLVEISQAGTYYINLVINNETLTDSLELTTIESPLKPFSANELTVCLDEIDFELDALNTGSSYLWSTGDTTQILAVPSAGEYFVEITDSLNICQTLDTIRINSVCKTIVTFPNIFTPNGDFSNDLYELTYSNSFEWLTNFEFQILNRWGQEVYKVSGEKVFWNGKLDGNDLNPGVYFYRYSYNDLYTGELNSGHGNIQLVR